MTKHCLLYSPLNRRHCSKGDQISRLRLCSQWKAAWKKPGLYCFLPRLPPDSDGLSEKRSPLSLSLLPPRSCSHTWPHSRIQPHTLHTSTTVHTNCFNVLIHDTGFWRNTFHIKLHTNTHKGTHILYIETPTAVSLWTVVKVFLEVMTNGHTHAHKLVSSCFTPPHTHQSPV